VEGDGEHPGNKVLIGGHNVKLMVVAETGKQLDVQVDGRVHAVERGPRSATTSGS